MGYYKYYKYMIQIYDVNKACKLYNVKQCMLNYFYFAITKLISQTNRAKLGTAPSFLNIVSARNTMHSQ